MRVLENITEVTVTVENVNTNTTGEGSDQADTTDALKHDLTHEIAIAHEETKMEIGELRRGKEELCNRVNQRVGRLEEDGLITAGAAIEGKTVGDTNLCQVAEVVNTHIESFNQHLPKFEAKAGENPVDCLLKLEEYAKLFGLTDGETLRCLNIYLKSTAQYWREVTKSTGNLRVQLHAERIVPARGKTLEAHLSEAYDKSRHLTPPISDEEFIAMVLQQLPYRFQTHWSGRVDPDLPSFREGILEFDRIERLQFSREHECTEAADKTTTSNQGPREKQYEWRYSSPYKDPGKVIFSEGDKLTEGGSTIQDGETGAEGEAREMTTEPRGSKQTSPSPPPNGTRDAPSRRPVTGRMYDPTSLPTPPLNREERNTSAEEDKKELLYSARRKLILATERRSPNKKLSKIRNFPVGQLVLMRALNVSKCWEHITKKLLPLFEGPYAVSSIVNKNGYELRDRATGQVIGRYNFSALSKGVRKHNYSEKKYLDDCCVPGYTDTVSTRHRFPVYEEDVFNIWIARIKSDKLESKHPLDVYKSFYVCGRNFLPENTIPGSKKLKYYSLTTVDLPGISSACNVEKCSVNISEGGKATIGRASTEHSTQHTHVLQQDTAHSILLDLV
ncbi:hypothetical protein PR048_001376 [Dryococelus australis]|uniref:Uncharacterized protein n=1 Tax=Dryococelus australis TaxID=614101 RepID=A0ABQ9IIN1_9NEOP|nr:hypothetical protein PR048_001376 [Dryococelus australis]